MILRGVKFDNEHSGRDWGLTMNSKEIEKPEPKTNYVSIEGRDSDLDLTETFGYVHYQNRKASFVFLLTEGSAADRVELIDHITAKLHGRKVQIIDDDHLDHYYVGRCKVTDSQNNAAMGSITVEGTLEPYRYWITPVRRNISLTTANTRVELVNRGVMPVTPTFTVEGTLNIFYNNVSKALSSGTYKLTDLVLTYGTNEIFVNGSGTINISYREGTL